LDTKAFTEQLKAQIKAAGGTAAYTTNAIEGLNAQLRKNTSNRKVFPTVSYRVEHITQVFDCGFAPLLIRFIKHSLEELLQRVMEPKRDLNLLARIENLHAGVVRPGLVEKLHEPMTQNEPFPHILRL
jgi:hypothetical protein